jgi:hypothetical protein
MRGLLPFVAFFAQVGNFGRRHLSSAIGADIPEKPV